MPLSRFAVGEDLAAGGLEQADKGAKEGAFAAAAGAEDGGDLAVEDEAIAFAVAEGDGDVLGFGDGGAVVGHDAHYTGDE
jgi:hypothetical protein